MIVLRAASIPRVLYTSLILFVEVSAPLIPTVVITLRRPFPSIMILYLSPLSPSVISARLASLAPKTTMRGRAVRRFWRATSQGTFHWALGEGDEFIGQEVQIAMFQVVKVSAKYKSHLLFLRGSLFWNINFDRAGRWICYDIFWFELQLWCINNTLDNVFQRYL